MPSKKKVNCEECQDTGVYDYHGFSMDICMKCNGSPTVKKDLTVEPVSNRYKLDFDDLERWALDGCPEGVSGKVQDVFALIEAARQLQADDLRKRMSDAVTLLYTHGILTEKMRAHCRSRLA